MMPFDKNKFENEQIGGSELKKVPSTSFEV